MSNRKRANRVRQLRTEKGWTQEQLASRADLRKETIYKIEAGRQGITERQVHLLAEALGIAVGELWEPDSAAKPGFAESEAEPFAPDADSFEARIPLTEKQNWYVLKHCHLDQIGYFDNMPVVIDFSKERMDDLHIGDVVICNKCSQDGRRVETIARQFVPPALLITNSLRNNLPILNLDYDDVSILAIVVHPRPRRTGPPKR